MLIEQKVEVKITTKNVKHFQNLGYEPEYHVDKGGVRRLKQTPILVDAKDLPKGSHIIVNVVCDNCGKAIKKTYKEVVRCESDACDIKCTGQLREKQELLKFKERIDEDPRDFLYRRYVNEKATIRQLAVEIYGNIKCATSVNGWLKKFNIPLRHGSEAIKTQWIGNEERRELSRNLAKNNLQSEEAVRKSKESQSTPEFRNGASERKKGENNPMYGVIREDNVLWNPDITDEQRVAQRKTYLDARFKKGVKARDSNTCKICGESKGTIIAHHLMSYTEYPEFRYDIDNGITLCEKCHIDFHKKYGWGETTKDDFEEYLKTVK